MSAPAATAPSAPPLHGPDRDRSIDLARAGALVVVVLLHATMVGIDVQGGRPVFSNALDIDGFAPWSWLVQVMPLFFAAGGFTAARSFRRSRARGASRAAFAATRVRRLLRPLPLVMLVLAAGLSALLVAGVPGDLVAVAGFRMSQPLWFLGVFVFAQALVPALVAAHDRAPVVTLAVLAAAVVAGDVLRMTSGVEALGLLGLASVWLTVQQLGFWIEDGRADAIAARVRWRMAAGAVGVLLVLVVSGAYAADMYVNLNPPTVALALFAFAQVTLFTLARPALRRWAGQPPIARAVDAIGGRAMTVYLWHMPALVALAGAVAGSALVTGADLPAPASPAWWLDRPAWLVLGAVVVGAVAWAASRFETRHARSGAEPVTEQAGRAALATLTGAAAVAAVLALGLGPATAVLSALLAALAVRLSAAGPILPRGLTPAGARGGRRSPLRGPRRGAGGRAPSARRAG
ncbi:acyltransferase [Microbacterium sp. JZ70]